MSTQAEEVDWDRLDKSKFFIYGAGMFSGVTVALYPLSVIKTKQMTLPGISGGFQGVKETASTIMRMEGIPGFYRGFATVMFGTIPARAVYLTTLEWTKSETAKVISDLGLTGPAAAGVANFAGGAVASLATQSVTVPIDVISQKQMVHGDETVVARQQHHRSTLAAAGTQAGHPSGQASSPPGPAAAASAAPSSSAASATGHQQLHATGPSGTAAAANGAPPAGPGAAGASGPPSASHSAAAAASPSHPAPHSQTDSTARTSGAASTSGRPAQPQQHLQQPQTPQQAAVRRIGTLQMVRLIVKEEGIGGLYRGFGASVATFVPSSAVWWGAYGTYQKLVWALLRGGEHEEGGGGNARALSQHSTTEVVAVQTGSSVLAGCTSSLVTTPLDLVKTRIQVSYKHDGATPTFAEVARQIAREEGARGFLRGAVPRMINASLWGTCMVTVYEYLKRVCAKEVP